MAGFFPDSPRTLHTARGTIDLFPPASPQTREPYVAL